LRVRNIIFTLYKTIYISFHILSFILPSLRS
jgi:hypothetical protein